MTKPIDKTKRYVLLDTNIISSFSNEDLGNKLLEVLREVVVLGYGIAISDITFLEIINGTSVSTEQKMLQTLNGVERFYIKKDILIAAARLGGLYKDHGFRLDQFGIADQIIAATSVMRNCIIFTKNGRDFPQPFFKELDRRMIEYTNKEYPVCVPTYFMQPQLEYIGEYHTKRIEKHLPGEGKGSE
jgi:predicted nucleic acid-binding protein